MAVTASTIQIALEAQTVQLKKGFADSRKSVDKLGASLSGKVATGMAKFHIALGAAKVALGAVTGSVRGLMNAMAEIDQATKFADRVGISADKLRVLSLAAEDTGVSTKTLTMSMQRMVRRVSEAAKGSGEAVKALKELGLSADRLNQISPDKQFGAIADAMNRVGSQSDKTRLAMKLFDSEGVSLINTMELGSQGLDKMADKAGNLGLLLGEESRKGAEAAMSAIGEMNATIQGLVKHIAVDLAPAVEAMADFLKNFFGWLSKAYRKTIGPIINGISKVAKVVNDAAWDIVGRVQDTNALDSFGAEIKTATNSMGTMTKQIEKAGDAAINRADKVREIVGKVKEEFAEAITPEKAIGAVTRGSSAGFSAVQESKRGERERRRMARRRNELLEQIAKALKKEGLSLATVDIGSI